MRLHQLLLGSLLPSAILGRKAPDADRFHKFHAKALTTTPLKLDDVTYAQLTATPRDYSLAVLLTALESRYGCALCREFQPEWDLLSKSWIKGDKVGDSRLVHGTLDFTDGKNTFQSVRSNLTKLVLYFCWSILARTPDCSGSSVLPAYIWPSCRCR